ncbi:MAG: tetratricopeptide repeat protein [Synechococcaceae cyanobacterium]
MPAPPATPPSGRWRSTRSMICPRSRKLDEQRRRAVMKIVMTLMVRNEADILARNLEFHRRQGVSHFLITDHHSSDQSLAIARYYEALGLADVFVEASDQFRQADWVTRMARLASSKYKADWVINSDADEFWLPAHGDLQMALSEIDPQTTSLTLPRYNVVYCHAYTDILLEGKVRYRSALAELPKTCHRGDPTIQISEGNQLAVGERGQVRRHTMISILHYPIRSYEQFQRKVVDRAANPERLKHLDPKVGWRRQAAAAHRSGQLREFFLASRSCGEIVMDATTASRKLEARTLVYDERIARFFQGTNHDLKPSDPSSHRFSSIHLVSATRPSPQLQVLFRSARAQEKAGAWPEAERLYRQLLEQAPAHGAARLQLAKVLHYLGREPEALTLLDGLLDGPPLGDGVGANAPPPAGGQRLDGSALEASAPLRAQAHTNRGALLQLRGDLDAAQRDYGEALRLEPSLTTAADNLLALALLLRSQGRSHQALEALRMILRATPQRPDMLLQLGITLMDLGRVEAAVPCFRRLLRQQPQLREGHYQLGQALAALGHTEAGIAELHTALALDPDATEVLVHLESQRLCLCDWDDYDNRAVRLLAQLQTYAETTDGPLLPPLTGLLFVLPPALHRRLGERWAEPTSRSMAALRLPPPPPRPAGRRLRIGYLSADFRYHAMGNLLQDVFSQHDRRRFEVFAYSLVDVSDAVTAVIRSGVDHFAMVAPESSEAIAQRIRADRIDVLIDLMGHTHHGRPGVLALRPAPLQLHYLGYPGSLGADWIDGVIADAWLIPPEHDIHYRETVHRLPWGFVSSGALPDSAAPAQPPTSREALGLPLDAVVYACFNRPEKITPALFDSWLEILRQVPTSVLWIINDQPRVEQRLRARMAAGLEPQRLVFSPKVESAAFGQHCALADLLLDTSPYGSGATAVTALAAGLPLLTSPGDTFVSRMGASLCAATGLEELICPTPEVYQQRAIALGRQPAELQRLRRHLLERHGELPLFNTAAWVGHLDNLLERLLREELLHP